MSISLKKWTSIDRGFEPVYSVFHFVMRKLTRLSHKTRDEIVIIKLFGMGSIVRLMDMCEERGVDTSRLTIVTSHSHKELCQLWGLKGIFIHTHSILALARGCWDAVSAVGSIRPRLIVDFERCSSLVGTFRTILAWRSGCRTVSFEQRSLESVNALIYPVDRLSQEQIFSEGIRHFPVLAKARNLNVVPIDIGKIIVNINASELLEVRRYDLDRFASAIRSIHRQRPMARFYLSGVKAERNYVQKLADVLTGLPVYNTAGEWTLTRLINELADCELLITGDSAPLHLGRYMKVTTLSIWGPTQPGHFGYLRSDKFEILSLDMPCSPCFLHPRSKPATACKGAITCMKQLDPDIIASVATKLLSTTETTREVVTPGKLSLSTFRAVDAV